LLGVAVAAALLLLIAGRSKSLQTDERSHAIDMFAAAWAGYALIGVIIVTLLVEFARGHGEPYNWLIGVYAGAYVLLAIARSFRH
jgi:hypothetical protein